MPDYRYHFGYTAPGLGARGSSPTPVRPATVAGASAVAPLTPSTSSSSAPAISVIDWRPSSLRGPQAFEIGRKAFRLPARAQVKLRGDYALVLSAGVVRVLSARGEGVLLQGVARQLAGVWDEL